MTLANGVKMPRFGLGTYKSSEGREVETEVTVALEAGYRSIDTASLYRNEAGIGRAIAASGVPREDLFLTTKVWNDEQGYDGTLEAFERSLERLGTDYVDLYLVHWPIPAHMTGHVARDGGDAGLRPAPARSACATSCRTTSRTGRSPQCAMVDQVEFHPGSSSPNCRRTAASMASRWRRGRRSCAAACSRSPRWSRSAERHGKSAAQVAIRWVLQSGHIAIPKSVHAERIARTPTCSICVTARDMAISRLLDAGRAHRARIPAGTADSG